MEDRKFLFDFAWPERKIAVEIQGGIWMGARGGHTSGAGYKRDCEKQALAAVAGWRVIPVTAEDVKDGQAMIYILDALGILLD